MRRIRSGSPFRVNVVNFKLLRLYDVRKSIRRLMQVKTSETSTCRFKKNVCVGFRTFSHAFRVNNKTDEPSKTPSRPADVLIVPTLELARKMTSATRKVCRHCIHTRAQTHTHTTRAIRRTVTALPLYAHYV